MESYVKDHDFHATVEDENTTGGNSDLLLHKEVKKRQDTTAGIENFRRVKNSQSKETFGTQFTMIVPKGQIFWGKGRNTNESFNFELKDSGYFQEESRYEAGSCFVGLNSSTKLEQYAHNAGIVVHLRDVCGQQKPKLIGCSNYNDSQGVIVYETIQLENASIRSVVSLFSENMEHEVPKELVKIGKKV